VRVATILLAGTLFLGGCAQEAEKRYEKCGRVIDGDTFVTISQDYVRLIGIDTPERGKPYYREARNRLMEYIADRPLRLETDVEDLDRFKRKLRYVWADVDNDGDEDFVNELMARDGFASAKAYKPNVKYRHILEAAEAEAKLKTKGIWSGKK